MRKIFLLLVVLLLFIRGYSQHVDWKDVAPIVYTNCATCHRPGEIGENYLNCMGYSWMISDTLSPNFYSIPYYVTNKLMPPWKADPTYHHYLDERILTPDEINLLDSFVRSRARVLSAGSRVGPPPAATWAPSRTSHPTATSVRSARSSPARPTPTARSRSTSAP